MPVRVHGGMSISTERLTIDSAWREVADSALAFVERFA
jgi:hypothetical protein